MNTLLQNISIAADEIVNCNLIKDVSEQTIIDAANEQVIFVYSMTRACPTSFLTCC